MAYGDYNGPDKPDKGLQSGSCNRTQCQCSPANWYNHGSMSWYCVDCAIAIGQDVINLRNWNREWLPKVGHPMFETQEMIDKRTASNVRKGDVVDENL